MSVKDELKDLVYEGLACLIMVVVMIALVIYTDLSKWPVIIIGTGLGIGVAMWIRGKRKKG